MLVVPRIRALVAAGVASIAVLFAAACREQTTRAVETPQPVIAWKAIGTWSGRGNRQTESFRSDTGALRVRWTATLTDREPKAAGALRVTAHSAISGRLLEQVVDHLGD